MRPAVLVLLGFLLFFGSHVGLATAPVRGRLVARLGEQRFVHFFSVVATATFAIWLAITAAVRHEGVAGLGVASLPGVLSLALAAVTSGFALAAGSLAGYARSPMALFSNPLGEVRGVARISRHGFFMGVAAFALGHVLLVPTLAGVVFFGGLAVHAIVGALHQDRKLSRKLGAPYDAYCAQTSIVPFAAILGGRQPLAWREQPWLAFAVGLLLAWGLRQIHTHLFAHSGLWIAGAVAGGGAIATLLAAREAKLRRLRHA